MQKKLSITSVVVATIAALCFAETDMVLPAVGCIVYLAFWLYAQTRRKPRAGTRGKENVTAEHTSFSKEGTESHESQTEVRQVWTTTGKMLTITHISER